MSNIWSASGAQVIALTTKNKQLAEFSNIIPTNVKKRIYDEVASLTYNDPRFQKMNERLGLRAKDLVKAKFCGLLKFREFSETPTVNRTILSQA